MADEIVIPTGTKYFEDVFIENLKDRKIIINDEINTNVIEQVILPIMKFNAEDKGKDIESRKPIFLYINSGGGDVLSGLNVISTIKNSKTPVIGVILTYGYSMAGVIFSSCHKRYMFEYSSLLIHDGSTSLSGSASKVKDLQKFYNEVDVKLKDIIVGNSKISNEEYDENIDREQYLFASDCKKKGLCDGIIGEDIELDEIL